MVIVAFIGVIVAVSLLLWILESSSSESMTIRGRLADNMEGYGMDEDEEEEPY